MKLTLPKVGDLESSRTPDLLELDSRGQNTSHWSVLYINGKVLKCRCPKWPCMNHLDTCNPSYGQKKGRESNWQFDSRPLKVGNRPLPDVCRWSAMGHWKALEESYNLGLDFIPIGGRSQELWVFKVDALPSHVGETHLRVSQSQVAELRLGNTLPASNSRKR
jgi:hypothetical protein